MESVDDLRTRLRELGYLTHGVERWFALDPWSSRTFWQELLLVVAKAGVLIAPFAALPMIAAMIVRNRPVTLATGAALAVAYLALMFLLVGALVTVTALALKARPATAIDHPVLLTAIALALSILLSAWIAVWWSGFPELPGAVEGAIVALLVLLLVAAGTVVFSAAILSFSVREARQIPAVARSPRSLPILVAGVAMIALTLGASRIGTPEPRRERPRQIVASQTANRVALLAVDGLTRQLYLATPDLRASFAVEVPARFPPSASAAERWATAGTGTARELHQVRSVESLRLPAGDRVLQQASRFDPLATRLAQRSGLVRRQPLPSAIRERDYAWEIVASRGIPAVAVNWWVSAASDAGPLRAVPQQAIFSATSGKDPASGAVAIDDRALASLESALEDRSVRLATAYLPALDILMNRLEVGQERKLALSLRVLDRIASAVAGLRRRGFDVILLGSPSEGGEGTGVLAATFPLARGEASATDLTPTLLDLLGFPASREMAGNSLLERSAQPRIDSFGSRTAPVSGEPADQSEYHDALRSLGYVR